MGLVKGGLGGDEKDVDEVRAFFWEEDIAGGAALGDEIGDGELLGGEDLVERGVGEVAAGVKEVGEVGLADGGLASEQGDAERAALDSAQ